MTPIVGDLVSVANHYTPAFHDLPDEDVYTGVPALDHLFIGDITVLIDTYVRWSGRRHFVLCLSKFGLVWIEPSNLTFEET